MQKLISLIAIIVLPVLTFGQNPSNDAVKQNDIIKIETITLQQQIENQIAFAVLSKNEVNNLSYKKSIELISIKAYRKSLQIKVKEIITC